MQELTRNTPEPSKKQCRDYLGLNGLEMKRKKKLSPFTHNKGKKTVAKL